MINKFKKEKILIITILAIILLLSALNLFNFTIDPFGVFHNKSYSIGQNDKDMKYAYIKNKGYKNFILGGSEASGISTEKLKEITGDEYFNMSVEDMSILETKEVLEYLLENRPVENILVTFNLNSLIDYEKEKVEDIEYTNFQLFKNLFKSPSHGIKAIKSKKAKNIENLTGYNPDGSLNRNAQDVEYIGSRWQYLKDHKIEFEDEKIDIKDIDKYVKALSDMEKLAKDKSVKIKFIYTPMYRDNINQYLRAQLEEFFYKTSNEIKFWDFGGSSYNNDMRFFYEYGDFRKDLGDKILETIYDVKDDQEEKKESFFSFKREEEEIFGEYIKEPSYPSRTENKVEDADFDIYIFYDIDEEINNEYTISPNKLERFLVALSSRGIKTILPTDLYNYVHQGEDLPKKSALLVFYGGYESFFEEAYPILKRYDRNAVVYPQGAYMGKKSVNEKLDKELKHFNKTQAKELLDCDYLYFGSGGYDLKINSEYQTDENTNYEKYKEFLTEDYENFLEIYKSLESDKDMISFLYPRKSDDMTELILKELGVDITITDEIGTNTIIKGMPQSLLRLRTIPVDEDFIFRRW